MISPLSPSYLIQNSLAATVTTTQTLTNQQEQIRQAETQLPPSPPLQEARPKPENFGSEDQFTDNKEPSLESRSQNLQLKARENPMHPLPPTMGNPVQRQEAAHVAQMGQAEIATREVNNQTKSDAPDPVVGEDRPTPSSRSTGKPKSPYLTEDPVVAGKIVDSVA
jgi:hypothetical protein